MKITNIAAVLAFASSTSHVAAFAPAAPSVSTGLTPVVEGLLPAATTGMSSSTALAMAKKKGKKGSAKQKNKKRAKMAREMEDAGTTVTVTPAEVTPQKAVAALQKEEKAEVPLAVKAVAAPKKEEKQEVPLAVKQKYEVLGRGMLEMRDTSEQKERVRQEELAKQEQIKAKQVLDKKYEVTGRGMLEMRLLNEQNERIRQEELARQEQIKRKNVEARQRLFEMRVILDKKSKAYKAEISQRALLVERLGRDARIKAAIRERKEQIAKREAEIAEARKQPKPPDEEKRLFQKYAAIEDLSEKAFTIKVDLGMIQLTPDPDDPDYDSTYDNEYASGMFYLN